MTESNLLYESEGIEAYYHPGKSDYLLVTFANMGFYRANKTYWGQSLVEGSDISSIGVVSKGPTWFPTEDMAPLLPIITEKAMGHRHLVTYGASMGGFAALKYSATLGANAAIACAPQFSIDPASVPDFARVFTQYFMSNNEGMDIQAQDLSDNCYVLYDPHHRADNFHASHLRKILPDINEVRIPYAGHEVVRLLAGRDRIMRLIDACLSHNMDEIRRPIFTYRKVSGVRARAMAMKLARRRPQLAERIFQKYETGCSPAEAERFRAEIAFFKSSMDIKNLHP